MTLVWNGDLSTNDKSQYGDVEYSGTFDGTPPLNQRVIIGPTVDGYQARAPGRSLMKVLVKPGDQYGSSSGERTLLRQYKEPFPPRREGWAAAMAMSVLFPKEWPGGSNFDAWQMIEWHGSAGPPACIGLRPLGTLVQLEVKGGPTSAWKGSGPDTVAELSGNLGVWHDFVIDYLLHSTTGRVTIHHRIPSKTAQFSVTANFQGVPTLYTGQSLYVLIGLYGPAKPYDRWLYHGGAREYSTVGEAFAYMNTLPSGTTPVPVPEPEPEPEPEPPTPEPTPPPVDLEPRVAELEDDVAKLETRVTELEQEVVQILDGLKFAAGAKSTFGDRLEKQMGWV